MYLSLLRSLFLHTPLSYHLCPFISLHRTLMIISCREGLVVRNSLNICFSGNVLIFLSLMNNSLPDIVFLLESFFFLLALWINQLTVFWPPKFLMRNLLIILVRITCKWWLISLLLLPRLLFIFNSRKFDSNVSWCGFFVIISVGVYRVSCMFIFMSFFKFEKFPVIISLSILSAHLSFFYFF